MTTFREFKEFIKSVSLAKTNRFQVVITGPSSQKINSPFKDNNLSLMAEYVSHPSLSLGFKDARISGPKDMRPDGTIDFQHTTSITFLLDEAHLVKQYFDAWMTLIIDRTRYIVGYPADYMSSGIIIQQLDMNDQITYTTTIRNAFPYMISSVDSSSAGSNTFNRITVGFAFKDWSGTTDAIDDCSNPSIAAGQKQAATPNGTEFTGNNKFIQPTPVSKFAGAGGTASGGASGDW
jgi:hypothetical protein